MEELATFKELEREVFPLFHLKGQRMIRTQGTPESQAKKQVLEHKLWLKGYFNPFPYVPTPKKKGVFDREANALKELEVVVCRVCGETITDSCPEHGTRADQEVLANELIAEQERTREFKAMMQEDSRRMFCELWWYVNGGKA